MGGVIKVIQPSPVREGFGLTTQYEYDVLGNLVSTTDPLGHETRYAYDNLGRQIGKKSAEGGGGPESLDRKRLGIIYRYRESSIAVTRLDKRSYI